MKIRRNKTKPARRYVRRVTYYVAVAETPKELNERIDALPVELGVKNLKAVIKLINRVRRASLPLPPQPRIIVETIKAHGRIERSELLRELATKIKTIQPIPWLFSYHKRKLIDGHYFIEVKEPILPMIKPSKHVDIAPLQFHPAPAPTPVPAPAETPLGQIPAATGGDGRVDTAHLAQV